MGLRRKFVLLGGFPVCVMHGSPRVKRRQLSFHVHEADQSFLDRRCLSGMALDRRNGDEGLVCLVEAAQPRPRCSRSVMKSPRGSSLQFGPRMQIVENLGPREHTIHVAI